MSVPDVAFWPVPFADIRDEVRRHVARLPFPIDSFLEDHILASAHYRILIRGEQAGFASIHHQQMITQFALDERFRAKGRTVFSQLRETEHVQSAFVTTSDGFYLAQALDDHRQLQMQANFFVTGPEPASVAEGFTVRPARSDDRVLIESASGDFFDDLERRIGDEEIFVTERAGEPVAFGISVSSALQEHVASIGMFTIEAHRRTGAGTATIAALVERCQAVGIRPIAGCWYYNHASKQTLERAGMYSPARLLKIDF